MNRQIYFNQFYNFQFIEVISIDRCMGLFFLVLKIFYFIFIIYFNKIKYVNLLDIFL